MFKNRITKVGANQLKFYKNFKIGFHILFQIKLAQDDGQ